MDQALIAKLLGNAALAALVASVSWDERPESGTLPAIVLTLVAPGRDYTHGGWDGLNETLVQFDVWGSEPDVVFQIAAAIPAAIEGVSQVAGWEIGPAFLEADVADRDELGGAPVFRRRQDWMIVNRPLAG